MDDDLFDIAPDENDLEAPTTKTPKRKIDELFDVVDDDLSTVTTAATTATKTKTKVKTKVKKSSTKPVDPSQTSITSFAKQTDAKPTPAFTSTVLTKKRLTTESQNEDAERNSKLAKTAPETKPSKKKAEEKKKEDVVQSYFDEDDNPFPLIVTTVKVNLIKRMFETVQALVAEAIIQFNTEHMTIFGVDSTQVAIVGATLEKKNFEKYHCERQFDFGVDTAHMKEMIQPVQKYDSLTFFKRNFD
jgi:hypothetical protein